MNTTSDHQDFQDDVAVSWEALVSNDPTLRPQAAPPAAADPEAPTTSLAVFDPVKAGLAELRTRYANVAFDLRTVRGNDEARSARKQLVTLRGRADDAYSNWNAPILEQQKKARALRDSIKGEIQVLEDPIDQQIKADEARRDAERRAREEAEAARLKRIRESLAEIGGAPASAATGTSGEIRQKLEWLQSLPLDKDAFEEFLDDAQALRDRAAAELDKLLAGRLQQEQEAQRLAEERAELERLRAEERARAAERERELAAERARFEAERAELERQRQAIEQERAAARAAEAARAEAEDRVRADAAAAAFERAKQAEENAVRVLSVVDALEAEVVSTQVAEQKIPEPPQATAPVLRSQEDAFAAELKEAVATLPARKPQRPSDADLTALVSKAFGVDAVTAIVWLAGYDYIEETDRVSAEIARAA